MEEAYRWDDYFKRVRRYLDSGRLDREELAPKRALERVLGEMRAAVLAGKSDWADVMKKKDFRLYFHIFAGAFDAGRVQKWFQEDPKSQDALCQLWAAGDQPRGTDGSMEETIDRIRAFATRMCVNLKGAGTRMRPISVLLMALGAERHPPFKTTEFKTTYEDIRSWVTGSGEKIHERVCRYGGHVPIRGVWHAGAMTGAVRWGPGLGGTPGTCASNTSNEKRRS